jgi:hypothetical protein
MTKFGTFMSNYIKSRKRVHVDYLVRRMILLNREILNLSFEFRKSDSPLDHLVIMKQIKLKTELYHKYNKRFKLLTL